MRRLTTRSVESPAEALHLVATADPTDPPVLLCQRCDLAVVVRVGRPVRCACGAVPCDGCAELLASYALRLS